MSHTNDYSFLQRLSDIFRAKGDEATADALVVQHEASDRTTSEHDRERIVALQRKGIQLDNQGLHEEAGRWLASVLLLAEVALGSDHVDLSDHLNDLARCRFNGGNFEAALPVYQRLLRLVEAAYGSDDMLAKMTRLNIRHCQQGLRTRNGVNSLQVQMALMLRQAQRERSDGATPFHDERDCKGKVEDNLGRRTVHLRKAGYAP